MKKILLLLSLFSLMFLSLEAKPLEDDGASSSQALSFSKPHGFYDSPFTLTLSGCEDMIASGGKIHYTLDGSEPTSASPVYTSSLSVKGNTIIRAAVIADGVLVSKIFTSTYLFLNDVLKQPNNPEGYPSTWGSFTDIQGTAPADYEMDPEMTGNSVLANKIKQGLKSLPVLSIVTDKGNLFSHENDEEKGGIYIFTGPPVGDPTGNGWTRAANFEMFGGMIPGSEGKAYDLNVTCGLRLHGGHGRLAEKNPKHSFRLVFKALYGEKSLKYPIFGENEPDKFNQLVLRCHYGNSWQHWLEYNRTKAQYTRDVWARRIQRKIGDTSVNALYVHVFLNGMYWGMYNIAERVDDQFGKDHLGGKKEDIDVVKIEEEGGSHHEAAAGDLLVWEEMVATAKMAKDDAYYNKLQGKTPDGEDDPEQEALLDVDAFINYMIINQYGGNNDWDHHNWYAVRRKGPESQGFRFLCWDSELVIEGVNDRVVSLNNGDQFPTGIFHNLLNNKDFSMKYMKRAKELLADDGFLGQKSAEAVWDSLYNNISTALYAEAARWGDYRRDVHQYSSRGQLYTVDDTYMKERNRIHNEYFPARSSIVFNQIGDYLGIDENDLFEPEEGWVALAPDLFDTYDGSGADAKPVENKVGVDWNMKFNCAGGTTIAGFTNVDEYTFADVTDYDKLVIKGTGKSLRILANRLVAHGSWKQIVVGFVDTDPYWDSNLRAIVIPLENLSTMNDTDNKPRVDGFVHLHALKLNWGDAGKVSGAWLVPSEKSTGIANHNAASGKMDGIYRNLQGQIVRPTAPGIYILNGKKILIK